MKRLIPALFILIGFISVYAYQHKPQSPTVQPAVLETAKVTRVMDGDTIQVSRNGKTETVRLIGVNTPETVDPKKPVECYGPEASAETKQALEGKQVSLEADPSQGDRDKYGRLLRYVYLHGENVSYYLIQMGYGREYTYDKPYKYQKDFQQAQAAAQQAGFGLWARCN